MLRMILMGVQVFVAFGIVGLVLLQRGKGADAGAGFGAGASGTVFGARGARTALSRATAIFAAIFMLNSLALAYMGTQQAAAPKTILDEAAGTPAPASDASKAPVIPAPATGSPSPAPGAVPSGTPATGPEAQTAPAPSPPAPAAPEKPQP